MKAFLSILVIFMIGCSSVQSTEDRIDRSSPDFKIAQSLHGETAKEEFEKNRSSGDLVFYAIEQVPEETYSIPGLSEEEISQYVNGMDIGFDVIDDTLTAPISTEAGRVSYYYSIVVEEFIAEYNRLVLNEYKTRAYQDSGLND